jgi:hypothetical protein
MHFNDGNFRKANADLDELPRETASGQHFGLARTRVV